MSWNYTGLPNTSSRDAVRILVGQVSSGDDVVISDEEITFALGQRTGIERAAAYVANMLASQFAAQPERESVGQLGLTWGDRAAKYRAMSVMLEKTAVLSGISPYVGGVEKADLQSDRQNTGLVQPAFTVGRDDNPAAVSTGSS
jgi:hypothetical protein